MRLVVGGYVHAQVFFSGKVLEKAPALARFASNEQRPRVLPDAHDFVDGSQSQEIDPPDPSLELEHRVRTIQIHIVLNIPPSEYNADSSEWMIMCILTGIRVHEPVQVHVTRTHVPQQIAFQVRCPIMRNQAAAQKGRQEKESTMEHEQDSEWWAVCAIFCCRRQIMQKRLDFL
jgi:hypothetical protein